MPIVTVGNNTGDTYSGIQDNHMDAYATYVNYNYGAKTTFDVGESDRIKRAIVRPNLVSLPAAAICIAATLYLYDNNDSSRQQPSIIQVYKIADANGNWVVGTKTGDVEAGSSCWAYKAYDPVTPVSWAGAAGLATPGTDYVNTILATASIADGSTGYQAIPFNAAGLAVLQSWFGGATNNGLLIKTQNEVNDILVSPSSNGTDTQRPYLSITYSLGSSNFFLVI